MKLVIASDIHGSALWCEKLLREVDAIQPDRLVLLGDILYHGPRNDLPCGYDPKQVIKMLNERATDIMACRGNCEAEVDQMVLDFSCMSDYLVITDQAKELFCTHGHVYSPEKLPALKEGSVFLYGHTHIKRCEVVEVEQGVRVQIVNPGSVSIPKDGSHSYAVYEDGSFELKVLE